MTRPFRRNDRVLYMMARRGYFRMKIADETRGIFLLKLLALPVDGVYWNVHHDQIWPRSVPTVEVGKFPYPLDPTRMLYGLDCLIHEPHMLHEEVKTVLKAEGATTFQQFDTQIIAERPATATAAAGRAVVRRIDAKLWKIQDWTP